MTATYEHNLGQLFETARLIAQKAPPTKPLKPKPLSPFFFFTDPLRSPNPGTVIAHLPQGSGFVYRHFGAPDRLTVAKRLKSLALERNLLSFVGNDLELALEIKADGVHLSEGHPAQTQAIKAQYPNILLTRAWHDLTKPLPPEESALDGVFISPLFPSQSPSAHNKPCLEPKAIEAFCQTCAQQGLGVWGLGGIGHETMAMAQTWGLSGFAAIEACLAEKTA